MISEEYRIDDFVDRKANSLAIKDICNMQNYVSENKLLREIHVNTTDGKKSILELVSLGCEVSNADNLFDMKKKQYQIEIMANLVDEASKGLDDEREKR